MADISKIEYGEQTYNIKDATARSLINSNFSTLNSKITTNTNNITALTNVTNTTFKNKLIDILFPVGSIYITMTNAAPFTRGTWTKIAAGRALVGVNSGDSLMNASGKTFGSSSSVVVSHTHTQAAHAHTVNAHTHGPGTLKGYYRMKDRDTSTNTVVGTLKTAFDAYNTNSSAGSVVINSGATGASSPATNSSTPRINATGVSAANTNYQPSYAVYVWRRTA